MATDEAKQLRQKIDEQKETLRQLRMVKMYRKKNDLDELGCLIDKWRDVCQQTLQTLHDKMPQPRPSMGELIQSLNLDAEMLKYNEEDEDFDT